MAVALVGAATFFAVARPEYHARSTTITVEMATEHQYVAADFRPEFATQGISLRRVSVLAGVTHYGDRPVSSVDDGFLISLYPKNAKVVFDSSGPKPLYDARLGNLEISYGGHDKAFAGRVTAAVAAIKR